MRNKLIFKNIRDHIIHTAITDERVWKDAIEQNKNISNVSRKASSDLTTNILQQIPQYYCVVDASWKSPTEKDRIGWSLYSKEGIYWLQGSSAIAPTNSPFTTEAMAMLLDVQQIHALAYNEVVIL